jgi:hypothetical protein
VRSGDLDEVTIANVATAQRETAAMGSKRYWIAVGVLAALVGLVVFVATSPVQDQAVVSSPTSTALADPTTTTTTQPPPTTTTQPPATTTTQPPTTTMQPPATTTSLPPLPATDGGPDWLDPYEPIPEVLSGQVVDVDGDGEPDIALFGAAESPMIYTIDDGDPIERVAPAEELAAARERIAELESDVSALEQITRGLTDELAADDNAPALQSATSAAASLPLDAEDEPTTTPKDPEGDIESSGLTSAQQSLLLALISTAGIVLAGLGAPVMTAWARQRFGGPSE